MGGRTENFSFMHGGRNLIGRIAELDLEGGGRHVRT
ncbi:hypothetical protein J2Z49_002645 [Desulfofundulus luciae]|uniref:Uncharacterized protein n=1 Tax=Desulfofundulus luciae TaxID=74702 RepID=A0ABU0B476_9FIRM|nr:hypothetical protein [Desulfofundulus luciae]